MAPGEPQTVRPPDRRVVQEIGDDPDASPGAAHARHEVGDEVRFAHHDGETRAHVALGEKDLELRAQLLAIEVKHHGVPSRSGPGDVMPLSTRSFMAPRMRSKGNSALPSRSRSPRTRPSWNMR